MNQQPPQNLFCKIANCKMFIVTICSLLCCTMYSQEAKLATIIQYDDYISTAKIEKKITKPLRVEALINEIQSSIYLESDGIKIYGVKPVSLFTSVKNMVNIENISSKKENIEIINIRINTFDDLKSSIDFSVLKNLKKLKYVYIISDIKCNQFDIESLLKNTGKYIVLFKIANNS